MKSKKYTITEDEPLTAAEPAVAVLSSTRRTGWGKQVVNLIQTDELGRVTLSSQMREAVAKAERDYEQGKCLSEEEFKQRFQKWL